MAFQKTKYYIVLATIIFSWANFAYANLEITSVMYDPEGTDTNREWIKLYNDGSEVINIISGKTNSAWRFGDGENGETLHYISGEINIGPGEYAILASDKDTYISEYSYSGLIADTSMSLNNTNGVVKIWDGSSPRNVVASFEYTADSSNSGSNNTTDNTTNNSSNNTTISTSSSSSNTDSVIFKINTKIISPKNVIAGVPFPLNSLTTTNTGKTYSVGKFVWNFGDGMTREVGKSEPFDYVYEYPGEYVLVLSYFDSLLNKTADATDRVTIKVVPPEIFISSVGNDTDPFIEIENKSSNEAILSNWIVTGGMHYFVIPSGTTLLPGKKIKLSPKITGFIGDDIKFVTITNPNKLITASYPVQTKKFIQKSYPITVAVSDVVTTPKNNIQEASTDSSNIINLNDLGADAENSRINISDSTYALIGLLIVIGIGMAGYLLIKKKNNNGDYIKNELRAEDMTLIE